jgi:hypothetical protein
MTGRMILFGLMIAGLVALQACGPRKEAYVHRLDDQQLTRLLLDLQFAEVTLTGQEDAMKDSLRTIFWDRMSAIYGLSPEDLREEVRQLEMDPPRHMAIVQQMGALHDSIR